MPQLILLGGFTTHQPQVQPFPTALLLLWSCSGAELTWSLQQQGGHRVPGAVCTDDAHWYHSSQTAHGPSGTLANGITKIILCTQTFQHTYLPGTEGALKSSTTLVPAASPAPKPSPAPGGSQGGVAILQLLGNLAEVKPAARRHCPHLCLLGGEHRGSGKGNKMVGCCCPAWFQDAPVTLCWIPC